MFSENDRELRRALLLAHSNCLCSSLLHLPTHKPAEEAGIGDTPSLEDQAAGHVTQGQWLELPAKPWGLGGGRWQVSGRLDPEKRIWAWALSHRPGRFLGGGTY